jgi:hypothetical protein
MPVERIDPARIAVLGGNDDDVRRFVESDFRIRSGLCPNGHGLMRESEHGQDCPVCGFGTNVRAERTGAPQ